MTTLKIPFCPLPIPLLLRLAEKYRGIGSLFATPIPKLRETLKQADLRISAEEYGAIMAIMFVMYFVFGTFIAFIFTFRLNVENWHIISPLFGLVGGVLVMVQLFFYPNVVLKKKVRDLERNLIFALRTILIEIKSGVTLFDAISIVAEGDNGQVSREFRVAVEKIQTGYFQNEALEDLAENNPSLYFRRALWQLVNGLKAGSDTSMIMQALVESLTKEKENQVRKYGNSLKLLSLLYMMLGAIIPALGLTFLIILSTFPQIKISPEMFWGMLGMIVIGQFMFLGIIKSSRPTLLGD